jgi:hypothetical protein
MLLRAIHLPPVPKEHANERYLHYKDKMIELICLFMNLSVFMLLSLSIKLNWCYNDGEGRFWMVEDPETECRWNLAFPAPGSQNIARWGVHLIKGAGCSNSRNPWYPPSPEFFGRAG